MPLACNKCNEPISRENLASVIVFSVDRTDGVHHSLRVPWNTFNCSGCGDILVVKEPIMYVDLNVAAAVLAYSPFEATAPRSQYLEVMMNQFKSRYPKEASAISSRIIRVSVESDVSSLLLGSLDLIDAALAAQRRIDARLGRYGHDRVSALLADIGPDGQIACEGYEVSEEFLGNDEYWQSLEEEDFRRFLLMQLGRDADLSGRDASRRTLSSGSRSLVDQGSVRTLLSQHAPGALGTEVREFIAAHGVKAPSDSKLPMECQIALLMADDSIAESPLFSDVAIGGAAGFAHLLSEIWARRSMSGGRNFGGEKEEEEEEEVVESPESGLERSILTMPISEFVSTKLLAWNFSEVRSGEFDAKWETIVRLIESKCFYEALERSEMYFELTTAEEEKLVLELLRAIITASLGYAPTPRLVPACVERVIERFNVLGWADRQVLVLCGFAMETVASYLLSRGSPEHAAICTMNASTLYGLAHHEGRQVSTAVRASALMAEIGRPELAVSIARSALAEDRGRGRLAVGDRAAFLGQMAAECQPTLHVEIELSTGDCRVSEAATNGGAASAAGGGSDAPRCAVLELVSSSTEPVPLLERSIVVGNPYLDELLALWLHADDAFVQLQGCQSVLQAQAMLNVSARGLLAVATELLQCVSNVLQAYPDGSYDVGVCIALATACQTFTRAALETDDRLARGSVDTNAEGLRMWLAAERVGSTAQRAFVELSEHRDHRLGSATDLGSAAAAIVMAYPLALESLGRYWDAVSAYRRLVGGQEQRRAKAETRDIVLTAQGEMKPTYTRLSRCLFALYRLEGDLAYAVEAAEALELHKARHLRSAILAAVGADRVPWQSEPLRYAASQLPTDHGICCLGIHPATARIGGRWMCVGISGHDDSSEPTIWANELSPGQRLLQVHDWFKEHMQQVSRLGNASETAPERLRSLIEEVAPESEMLERFVILAELLAGTPAGVRNVYLSTEGYAFHLPWSGASMACRLADSALAVSVVPSCAFAIRNHRQPEAQVMSTTGVIYFDSEDDRLRATATQMLVDIQADSDGGSSWTVEVLEPTTQPESTLAGTQARTDLLIVLSHGSEVSGVDTGRLRMPVSRPTRCVLLLGCWSATVTQDTRHMEIEGIITDFLEAGAEAVIASVWPLPAFAAVEFGSAFAAALESGADLHSAFSESVQLLRLSGGAAGHPAVWGGFVFCG
jgi:hypothetical protein